MPDPFACSGAALCCSCGGTGTLNVLPDKMVNTSEMPAATIMDNKPFVNLAMGGTCAVLTAEASGVSMPCVPNTPGPWAVGKPTVTIKNQPRLTQTSTCMCANGGVISIVNSGQVKEIG